MAQLLKRILIEGGGAVERPIPPSANAYYDAVGQIDIREQGGYYDHIGGQVALYIDAPPSQQGGYFDRV